jgi:glutamate synthase (NADPH/NADH) small chain
LLRYGIPDFKLDKSHIDRRINQLSEEGIIFHTDVNVGVDISSDEIISLYDAIILAGGAEMPRDLPIQGRNFKGIHYAMDFLPQQNRRVSNESYVNPEEILATSKNVVVIGGGDTGSDCIGTSIRQGAISVTQLEIMPEPPEKEDKLSTWPNWPLKLRTSSSQEEGANREFSVMTQSFEGDTNGNVKKLHCIKVDKDFKPIESSEFHIKADLVLLAMGFVSPKFDGLLKDSKVNLDNRKNVLANTTDYKTNLDKVWTAGDMRRGQSLVVWAIREGRQCARAVDEFLMGNSLLPR